MHSHDGKGRNTYGQLLSKFRDVQLELGIFAGLSRAAAREGETNTDHDSDDSTLLNDMAEVSTTIHKSKEKMSTEPQASISKPRDTSPVNPQLDKVDSPNDDDIIMGSQSDDDTITAPGENNTGRTSLSSVTPTARHHQVTLKRGLRRQLRDIE